MSSPSHSGAWRASQQAEGVSLLRLAIFLLRYRWLLLGTGLAFAVLALTVRLLLPASFTTTASFIPQGSEMASTRLAGLAAQFGVDIPGGEAGQSPSFYAALLETEDLLREAVLTEYEVDGREASLVALLDAEGDSRETRVHEAVEELRERVRVETDAEAGLVYFSVTMPDPGLSAAVAGRTLELIGEFDLQSRQSQARAEREFLEDRLAAARVELQRAEDSLESFLEANRRYENSPRLTFEFERLQRRVSLRQNLFTTLSESFEEARLAEVRDTPLITVVETPDAPAEPDSRGLIFTLLVGLVVGVTFGLLVAVSRELLVRSGEYEGWEEFRSLRADVAEDFRTVWRGLRPGARDTPAGTPPDGAP